MRILLFLANVFFVSQFAMAEDGRLYETANGNAVVQKFAQATGGVFSANRLKLDANGNYDLTSDNQFGCPDKGIPNQNKVHSHCSSTLVRPNVIVTAAHCFRQTPCEKSKFVFGVTPEKQTATPEEIYSCKRVVAKVMDPNDKRKDIVVIELDRAVVGVEPVPFRRSGQAKVGDRIYTMGHPNGSAQKYSSGEVKAVDSETGAFSSNAFVTQGMSGGAVFNEQGLFEGVNTTNYLNVKPGVVEAEGEDQRLCNDYHYKTEPDEVIDFNLTETKDDPPMKIFGGAGSSPVTQIAVAIDNVPSAATTAAPATTAPGVQ